MHLRVVKTLGTYKIDQRLKMDNFFARQLIVAGIAVEDEGLGAGAMLTTPEGLSDDDLEKIKTDWEATHAGEKPKRRYRRRDLTADE